MIQRSIPEAPRRSAEKPSLLFQAQVSTENEMKEWLLLNKVTW